MTIGGSVNEILEIQSDLGQKRRHLRQPPTAVEINRILHDSLKKFVCESE